MSRLRTAPLIAAVFAAMLIAVLYLSPAPAAVDGNDWQRQTVVSGLYKASRGTLADGETDSLRMTSAGLLSVSVEANTSGATTQEVVGDAADGAAKAGNPVLIGGQDGTNAQSALTDTTGRFNIVGAAADGAAVAGNPLLIGGQDGTNAQSLKTNTTGNLEIAGDIAHDTADAGNPFKLGGKAITGATASAVSAADDRVNAHFDVYGRQVTRPAGSWQVQHTPAANTQATIAQGAGAAGVKNVCTSIACTFSNNASGAAAVGTVFNLRDGATGAGTILWSATIWLPATAGDSKSITLDGLWIEGTAATAMTLEAAAAGGANTVQSVAMTGTITQ